MKHARLSPSSSARWLTCTASVELSEQYENNGNTASEWGTCVHYIGEQILKGEVISVGDELVEQGIKFTVDEEMLDVALEYTNYCRDIVKGCEGATTILIEETFNLSSVSPNQFGTSDCTILDEEAKHLHIVDLKTGHHIVSARENTQLMLYAIGAIDELEVIHDIDAVTLHICQGRVGHYDDWTLTYDELMQFKFFAMEQAEKIISGNTEFKPTEKGCKWCPHQTNCEALAQHVEKIVSAGFDDISEIEGQADKVSYDNIKKILDNKELILGFIKAIEDVALEGMQNGTINLDGYKLVRSRKHKAWIDKEKAEKYLVTKFGKSKVFKQTLITPTQALKLAGKEVPKHLEGLITIPKGDIVLAHASDKRQAIKSVCESFDDIS